MTRRRYDTQVWSAAQGADCEQGLQVCAAEFSCGQQIPRAHRDTEKAEPGLPASDPITHFSLCDSCHDLSAYFVFVLVQIVVFFVLIVLQPGIIVVECVLVARIKVDPTVIVVIRLATCDG